MFQSIKARNKRQKYHGIKLTDAYYDFTKIRITVLPLDETTIWKCGLRLKEAPLTRLSVSPLVDEDLKKIFQCLQRCKWILLRVIVDPWSTTKHSTFNPYESAIPVIDVRSKETLNWLHYYLLSTIWGRGCSICTYNIWITPMHKAHLNSFHVRTLEALHVPLRDAHKVCKMKPSFEQGLLLLCQRAYGWYGRR